MIKVRSLFLGSLCATITAPCLAQRCEPCMDMHENMHKKITKMRQEIDKLFDETFFDSVSDTARTQFPQNKDKSQVSLTQEKDTVVVKLNVGKDIKTIDASLQDDLLSVDIPEKMLKIYTKYSADYRYLSIELGHTMKEKTEQEGMHQEVSSFSTSQHGQTLAQAIKFQEAKVEYKDDTLSIIFPLAADTSAKTAHKIKVDIK